MKTIIALSFIALSASQAHAQGIPLDPQFGTGGKVATDIGTFNDEEAYAVACQTDGKIVAGGVSSFGQNTSASITRYLPNGTVNATFGSGRLPFAGNHDSLGDGARFGVLRLTATTVAPAVARAAMESGVTRKPIEDWAAYVILPNLAAENIAYHHLQKVGGVDAIGPIPVGLRKPVQVLQLGSSVRQIVDLVALTVVDAQMKSGKLF